MRLISEEEGGAAGIMGIERARALAKEMDVDLVEVSPTVHPPVCRLMDFGKYLYRQRKQEQKHKASQKSREVKGIRLSLRTGEHDIDVKLNQAKRFLEEGNSLKFTLIFRGREVTHYDLALEKMVTIRDSLKELAKVDQEPKKQGYNLIMILSPLK